MYLLNTYYGPDLVLGQRIQKWIKNIPCFQGIHNLNWREIIINKYYDTLKKALQ